MTTLRFGDLPTAMGRQPSLASQTQTIHPDDTIAIYVDATKTIYLPDDWAGRMPAELSVLVHGLVHHMQNAAGIKYTCAQERERLAYMAQDRWLGLFGESLADDFGLDPFTVLARTLCIY
jgi:hypothetical protein